jgi:hypothetical protein
MENIIEMPVDWNTTGKRADITHRWNCGLRAAIAYATEFGHTRILQDTVYDGIKLGHWIRNRRAEYLRGTMPKYIVEIVEQIPHWNWYPSAHRRQNRIEILTEAYAVMGKRALSPKARYKGVAIGAWVRSQRISRANGTMSPDVMASLDALPFWDWGNVGPYRRGKRS